MNTFAKIALVAAVAAGTAGAGGFVASRMLGQNLFEKKLEHLAKNPKITYENLEKTFDSRKDKIVVKNNNKYANIREYVFTIDTKFDISGFHSDFNVDYDVEDIWIFGEKALIKNKPENRGYIDFSYSSEKGEGRFENDAFRLSLIDESMSCDVGSLYSTISFTNSQLSREPGKLIDYIINKSEPIVQSSHVDFVKCGDEDISIEFKDLNVDIQQQVFAMPATSTWKIGSIQGRMSDDSAVSVGSAGGSVSLENNGSGDGANAFVISANVNDFNIVLPSDKPEAADGEAGDKNESAAAVADESADSIKIDRAELVISLNDLKKKNLEESLTTRKFEKLLENQIINLSVKSNVNTADGNFVLDSSLKTPDLNYVLQKHDITAKYSISEKLVEAISKKDESFKPMVDEMVSQGYAELKDGVYSTTITSKDSFEFYANGKLVEMF